MNQRDDVIANQVRDAILPTPGTNQTIPMDGNRLGHGEGVPPPYSGKVLQFAGYAVPACWRPFAELLKGKEQPSITVLKPGQSLPPIQVNFDDYEILGFDRGPGKSESGRGWLLKSNG